MRSTVSHRRWRSLRWSRRSAGTACATLRTVSGDCVVTTRQSLPERFSQALRGAPTPKHRLVRADQPTIHAETLRPLIHLSQEILRTLRFCNTEQDFMIEPVMGDLERIAVF